MSSGFTDIYNQVNGVILLISRNSESLETDSSNGIFKQGVGKGGNSAVVFLMKSYPA